MDKQSSSKNYSVIIILFALIIVIGLWLLNLFYLKDFSESVRGTYGDMFGVVNALFSGLAFAGIIVTIYLQTKELGLQRSELSDTRMEFNTQNHTLKLQRFENTFFSLLSIHHQIVNSIDLDISQGNLREIMQGKTLNKLRLNGRDVFKEQYDNLKQSLKAINSIEDINEKYLKYYEKVQTDFGHYFRTIYRIIKFVDNYSIDDNSINEDDKYKIKYNYTSMVRAQLSDYELLWIFYNCLSENGIEKFKPLIEKYTLFKNIPLDKLANKEHKEFYESSAYIKRI